MTGATVGEVPEAMAPAPIAAGYARIRALLHSTFVPTVYRRLAVHPQAFDLALDRLPAIVALGESTGFVLAAQEAARLSLSGSPDGVGAAPAEVATVVQRYRAANPINLLFSMSVAGADARPARPVMEPPLAPESGDVWSDIQLCHGGIITPGLWRDLAPWPADLDVLWRSTRAAAAGGGIARARDAVRELAADVLSHADLGRLPTELAPHLPSSAVTELAWFPTGVATMVAEGEWLHDLIPHPQRKEQP
jgi:hypothetical protein